MRAKLWRYFKFILAVWILFVIFHRCAHSAWAQSQSYFGDSDIDYWREGKKVKPFVPSIIPPKNGTGMPTPAGSIIRQSDALPFDWKNYDDPKSPEFWDDGGDYVAPRPLREAVANPTPENLEKYANWQAKRLVVIAEFNQKLVAHSLAKESYANSRLKPTLNKQMVSDSLPQADKLNLREVSLMYFYQSSCPHCLAEKELVEALRRNGIQVTFVQLDPDENAPLHTPSVPYSQAFSKQFAITATPTWIFRRRENSVRLQGEQSEQEIQQEISKLFNHKNSDQSLALKNRGVSE
jgi:thiol-disulfide isomerase/thioredoxin